ncbi:MAG: hypothetical protein ACE5NC_04860 [Anaerolineae bacterium]
MHWSGERTEGDLLESHIHSFIVKIWLEEPANGMGDAVWRGRITHVPSEESRSLQDVEEISAFVVPYLRNMGVKFRLGPRLAGRTRRWVRLIAERVARGIPALQPVEVPRRQAPDAAERDSGASSRSALPSDSKAEEGGMISQES